MSRGINKVILVGNVGRDPEIRYLADGTCCCNLTVATSDAWTDKQSGDKKETTEWHRIVGWRRLGEIMGEFLKKGSRVYIEGKLTTRKWEKDGADHYTTEIVASDMMMLSARPEQENPGFHSRSTEGVRPSAKRAAEEQAPGQFRKPAAEVPQHMPPPDFSDEDIPF